MGLILDNHSAKLYESWYRSPTGRAMDKFIEKFISELLEPQAKERVLDIGCGAGNHLLFLNKFGLDITGIDASPYMINLARKRLGDRCNLKTGIAEDLPFDDNEFDLAVLINTLEFLDDTLKALREAGRVANRKVLICVINSLSWRCAYDKLYGLFYETLLTHIHPYHIWEVNSYVHKAYGPVPIIWRSGQSRSNRFEVSRSSPLGLACWPFGPFLGLLATIEYRLKTDNLPLKVRIGKIEQPVAGVITSMVEPDESRIPSRAIDFRLEFCI
jgi:ubiquinone/menaquinone biosynthesis C-methylase UbiE